ncbi:sulfotransferase, partial [Acidobacteriota bacterium]
MTGKKQPPIFIVSTGRCGSTLVTLLLKNHPDILSLSEFWPNRVNLKELFSDRVMSGKEYWDLLSVPMAADIYKIASTEKTQVPKRTLHETNYIRRITLPTLEDDYDQLFKDIQDYVISLPEAKPAEHILDIFDFIRKKMQKKIWVERTGANLDFLHRWKKLWPNLKLIHIYRDGRNCAISMGKHPAFKQQIIRTEIDKTVTFYNIVPVNPDSFTIEEFRNKEIPLERYGELWNTMIINGLNELKDVPGDQQISISYESFVENPGFQLKRLIDFIDPELESENWIKNQLKILHKGSSNWEQLD